MSVKNEIWKPIKDFEDYLISSHGQVYSKKTNKLLTLKINKYGYVRTTLAKNSKRFYFQVHRLVASAFIENIDKNKCQVNHIDGNKLNNHIENLEWVTPSENQLHSYKIGLQKKKFKNDNQYARAVNQFDKDNNLIKCWNSLIEASLFYKPNKTKISTSIGNIWKSLNGIQKTAYGFIWRYVNEE